MEATQATATKSSGRRRIKKLTPTEIADFPTAIAPPVKKVEPEFVYYIHFNLPVSEPIGTAAEKNDVYQFIDHLDSRAKEKHIGAVTSVSVNDGLFEVVLTLNVTGEQEKHGAPAADALTQLNDFLIAAPQLKKGGTWKAKVNGTTIVSGRY